MVGTSPVRTESQSERRQRVKLLFETRARSRRQPDDPFAKILAPIEARERVGAGFQSG